MNIPGRRVAAAAMVVLTLSATGCGGESDAVQQDPTIDLNALDVGGYRHEPKDFAPPDRSLVGRAFEAERLGAAVPLMSEIDAGLDYNLAESVHVFLSPGEGHNSPMSTWLSTDGFADDAKGFIAGFATSAQSDQDYGISYGASDSVLLFDSEQAASSAAAALAQRGWSSVNDIPPRVEPVHSAAHPTAISSWLPDSQVLASWYATGKFVIVALAESEESRSLNLSDRDLLQTLTDKTITLTSERLRSFTPTPRDQLTTVPFDPDGMLRISLPRPDGDSYTNLPGVYTPAAFLHLENDPERAKSRYDKFGVDRVAANGGRIYRARDMQAAKQLRDDLVMNRFTRPVESPIGLPTARCRRYRGPVNASTQFYCYVAFDRYVVMTWGLQLADAQQRVSAQYSILARSK
ncbi:hypothetical protein [Nocardia sp. NPDC056000]|uniref:DUF7373 family lipoprotein n=1 Tax=Nocardia sp. NPDC056000 TaxID=3345674 RepID=UPI0035DEB14D